MSIAKAPELMTNDELAAEIERLWKAEQQAEAAHATLYRRLHWNSGTHAEYDELGRLRSASVEARGRASALMVKRIDAILAALRTPAAAVGEGAVERVARAIEGALCEYIDYLRAPREHTPGTANQMVMNAARAALAAMPGAGVAEDADHEPFDPANPKLKPCPFCGGKAHLKECDVRGSANFGGWFVECSACTASSPLRFSAGDDARPLVCEQWNSRAALSAAPPPAAESRAGEVD